MSDTRDPLRGGFGGSIPANYDQYLRPLLFEPYADDLIGRLKRKPHMRILEIACGTGVVTERLERTLGSGATIVASDLNAAMVEVARDRLPGSKVTWQVADASQLPFEEGSFDAVVCQFGWMFFPDKELCAREARRVLVPGGQLLFNVWDSIERNEIGLVVQRCLARLFGEAAPTFLQVPYGYHDADAIAAVLRAARFGDVLIEHVELDGNSPSAATAARGYAQGSPLANELATQGPDAQQHVLDEITKDMTERFGSGPLRVKLNALVGSGIAI
jgi:ubiquinone/menaquinone biosynthesis C-methylase UbiE